MKELYVITDEKLTPYDRILRMVEEALEGGAKLVQLRDKNNSDDFLLDYAVKIRDLCHRYGSYFIINDRVQLALKSRADGVHVGEEDENIERVMELMKGKIVGVSCYGSVERAKEMEDLGASYVAFGSFYFSPTKPKSKIVPKDIVSQAKKELKIPICVIGGLTVERAKELVVLGADLVAVINDVWTAECIKERCREYLRLFT
ncbi:MAG: thiamine phosphate synthase [Hydrogenothermaceae bacterium]|nr:thiamine phosphate synthase [Hydrogenothermaceae bacterium]